MLYMFVYNLYYVGKINNNLGIHESVEDVWMILVLANWPWSLIIPNRGSISEQIESVQ
jgi:hypothetical protein